MQRKAPKSDTPAYTQMAADVYDTIYSSKDYKQESQALIRVIAQHKKSEGTDLLDVACGTGRHLPYLLDSFTITGVDLSQQQLSAARARLPEAEFIHGDMRKFELDRQFDVVTCLFSSIGYVHPYKEMKAAVQNMADHLKPGGVMVIEPWLKPDVYDATRPPHREEGKKHPAKDLVVTRTGYNDIDGNVSVLTMHHEVTQNGQQFAFTEEHRLAMYTTEEFIQAFTSAGLSFTEEPEGLSGRGIYIGTKPL